MKILFIHQNFPGQFKHLAPVLARVPGYQVSALRMKGEGTTRWQGIDVHSYRAKRGTSREVHPWVSDLETKTIRGEACFHAALALKDKGYTPDVIIAHPGWGETLFIKEVWPQARLGIYCEFYYHAHGADTGFDPEFGDPDPGMPCRLRMKNANNIMHFDIADGGLSPTRWQASTFPEPFRSRIAVIHDGIDTDHLRPATNFEIQLHDGQRLSRKDEIITFVNRDLEPTRGYHSFMRALPEILERCPGARVFIVGGSGVSYGARNKDGKSWKEKYIEEVRPRISDENWKRVHFVGKLPYKDFVHLLQLSSVHVYLTYPFVLSWSLLEAMSIGCAIVASDTQPLHEAIRHDETGRLVNFFDIHGIADEVVRLLESPDERARLGKNAREFAIANYDLKTVCLPRLLEWVKTLAATGKTA